MENVNVPVTTVNAEPAVPFKVKYMLFTAFLGILLAVAVCSILLTVLVFLLFPKSLLIKFFSSGWYNNAFLVLGVLLSISLSLSFLSFIKFRKGKFGKAINIPFALAFLLVFSIIFFVFKSFFSIAARILYLCVFFSFTGVVLSFIEGIRRKGWKIALLCWLSFLSLILFGFLILLILVLIRLN